MFFSTTGPLAVAFVVAPPFLQPTLGTTEEVPMQERLFFFMGPLQHLIRGHALDRVGQVRLPEGIERLCIGVLRNRV
jgi:hypothetical protein